MKILIFITNLCLISLPALAQQFVTGKVLDQITGEPLIGVNVYVQNTTIGTVTDTSGYFMLSLEQAEAKLVVNYGLSPSEFVVKAGKYYTIFYGVNPVILEELIVLAAPYHRAISQLYAQIPSAININNQLLNLDEQTNIATALNRVPGIYMHSGALNTNRITVRGIGSRNLFGTAKIRAFLDEIPLTNGAGATTLEDIDLSLVEHVDIVKGPTSSAYGAGLGGVIRLNPNWKDKGTELSLSNTLGSYKLQRSVLQYKHYKDDFSLNVGLNRTHSDGYRDNSEYDRLGLSVLGSVEKDKYRLTFLLNHIDLKAFIPSSLNETDYLNNPQKAAFTWAQIKGFEDYTRTLVGVSYRSEWTRTLTNTTSLFTTQFRSYESRPFNILRENSTALGGRTKFRQTLTGSNFIEMGAEYFSENYDWQTNVTDEGKLQDLLSDNTEHRQYLNTFLQTKWFIQSNLSFTAGLNLNTTNYNLTDRFTLDSIDISGDYSFESVWSPFLSLYYYPNWTNQEVSFYGIASHGFAPPTLEETLTPDGAINPNIQPERGWNFEIGSRGALANSQWRYNLSLYTMRIQDLLVARRTNFDQFIGINAGKTVHNGVELSLNSELQYFGWTLKPFLNYAFSDYKFQEFVDGEDDYSGNELTGTARHIASMGALFEQNGWYGNLNYQFVDAMPLRDDNSIYSEAYNVINAKIGYQFQLGKHCSMNAALGINNVWDEKYASMLLINAGSFGGAAPRYYYPGLPRNYYGSLKLKCNLNRD